MARLVVGLLLESCHGNRSSLLRQRCKWGGGGGRAGPLRCHAGRFQGCSGQTQPKKWNARWKKRNPSPDPILPMNSKENQLFGRETGSTFRSAFSPEKSGTPAGKSGTHQLRHKILKKWGRENRTRVPRAGLARRAGVGCLGWPGWLCKAGCDTRAIAMQPNRQIV